MELNNFGSYAHITTMRQIFELQAKHYANYLARCEFTRADYYRCRIGWRQCRWWQCAIHCTMIVTLVGIFTGSLPWFDRYVEICAQATKIKRYDIFIITEIIGFGAAEVLWFDTFVRQLIGGANANYDKNDDKDNIKNDEQRRLRPGTRHGMLEVAYEYADELDQELPATEHATILKLFHRIAKFAGIALKTVFVSLIQLIVQVIVLSILDLYRGQINFWHMFTYVVTEAVTIYQATAGLNFVFIVMPHLIFVLYIFRGQMIRYKRALYFAQAISGRSERRCVTKFATNYVRLHRHVLLFNESFRIQMPINEFVFKFAGLLTVMFFLKQNDSSLNAFAIGINAIYACLYVSFQFTQSKLSYFPNQNLCCYRRVMSLCAKAAKRDLLQRCAIAHRLAGPKLKRSTSDNIRGIGFQQRRYVCDFRYLLQLDHMVAFLANNLFGFTYGRTYLITSQSVLSALGQNFYIITLLYKRFTI